MMRLSSRDKPMPDSSLRGTGTRSAVGTRAAGSCSIACSTSATGGRFSVTAAGAIGARGCGCGGGCGHVAAEPLRPLGEVRPQLAFAFIISPFTSLLPFSRALWFALVRHERAVEGKALNLRSSVKIDDRYDNNNHCFFFTLICSSQNDYAKTVKLCYKFARYVIQRNIYTNKHNNKGEASAAVWEPRAPEAVWEPHSGGGVGATLQPTATTNNLNTGPILLIDRCRHFMCMWFSDSRRRITPVRTFCVLASFCSNVSVCW